MQSADAPAAVTVQEYGTRSACGSPRGTRRAFFAISAKTGDAWPPIVPGNRSSICAVTPGGFAIQAKKLGNAAEVTGVELDEGPLQLARENARLNQVRVNFVQSDAFAYMRDMLRNGRQYDVVVLDPPKLIRTRDELEDGRRKHFDLNRLAMQLVRPGGLLLSCTLQRTFGRCGVFQAPALRLAAGRSALGNTPGRQAAACAANHADPRKDRSGRRSSRRLQLP